MGYETLAVVQVETAPNKQASSRFTCEAETAKGLATWLVLPETCWSISSKWAFSPKFRALPRLRRFDVDECAPTSTEIEAFVLAGIPHLLCFNNHASASA